MPDVVTAILAIWGAVLSTLAVLLHGLRFWWERPQLKMEISEVVVPADDRWKLLGFEPADKLIVIEVTKLGQGSATVQSGGFRLPRSRLYLFKTTPMLPARLTESDRLTFFAHRGGLVKALRESGAKTLKQAYCKTTDGRTRTQAPPKWLQEDIRREVNSGR